jgi:hypothetical protein
MLTVAKTPRQRQGRQPWHGVAASFRTVSACGGERSTTMRELTVTLVVRVRARGDDDEATGREVEALALRALDAAGLDPVSCGYGFKPGP